MLLEHSFEPKLKYVRKWAGLFHSLGFRVSSANRQEPKHISDVLMVAAELTNHQVFLYVRRKMWGIYGALYTKLCIIYSAGHFCVHRSYSHASNTRDATPIVWVVIQHERRWSPWLGFSHVCSLCITQRARRCVSNNCDENHSLQNNVHAQKCDALAERF